MGKHTNPWANLWSDEQKPHMRLCARVRLQFKLKPNSYTESCMINVADIWREHEGYAKASRSFNRIWKERDSAQPKFLEAILYKDNFNRAYKRVKANKGKHGVDGMTVEEAFPYLREHQKELTDRIIQQAIAQQLMPIYEPLFIETSYGYRPNKSAKDAIIADKSTAQKCER